MASSAEWSSGSVTISSSGVPPRLKSTSVAVAPWIRPDAATWTFFAASSSRCARTMPTSIVAVRRRHRQVAARAERLVVLGDLVRLRQVGIEVVLAVEHRPVGDRAAEREPELDRLLDRRPVRHRQRAREGEADRAGLRVRPAAEAVRAAAEHLRPRLQLHVDLEADHRLPGHRRSGAGQAGTSALNPAPSSLRRGFTSALRDDVEADLGLEGGRDAVEHVLRELRPDQLQPDRQPVRRARTASRGSAGRPCSTGS